MTTLIIKTFIAGAVSAVLATNAVAQSAKKPSSPLIISQNETAPKHPAGSVANSSNASPIYGVTIPEGYREWKVIAVNHDTGKFNQLRAQLGNDIAFKAMQEGKLPFPDGAIIAALHWNAESSEENNKVLAVLGVQSVTPTSPANVQFMVKDSKKYATTGGWGFADFKGGKPGNEALHQTCFACHVPAKAQDYVFTHFARTP